MKGQTAAGLLWDASASFGSNQVGFFIHNTVNASLGPQTPDQFDPGLYRQRDLNVNLDVSYAFNEMLHVAGGAEWREERFEIGLGRRGFLEDWPLRPPGLQRRLQRIPRLQPDRRG